MKEVTRIGIIGAGAMGRNHARVLSEMPSVRLAGIADTIPAAAQGLAQRFGCSAFADYNQMLDTAKLDAVIVVVPTMYHLGVAEQVIARGLPLLVEKPIALTTDEAQRIIGMAQRDRVKLAVGHVERFNPAVIALKQRLAKGDLGRMFQINARRQGPLPERIRDVGVAIDLAVHDLDIMRYVSGSEITRVYAETSYYLNTQHEDSLSGLARLDNGTVGTLAINWFTPTKIRELCVIGEGGMFRVDYLTQDLFFYENATTHSSEWETLQVLRGVSEGSMTRFAIAKKEPLRAELEAFVAAVRDEAPIAVCGEDGLLALALAQAMLQSSQTNQPVHITAALPNAPR
jgi:predicted dehydrogenase